MQTGYENSQNTSRNLVRQLRYSDFSKEAPNIVSKIAKKGLVRSQTTEQSKTFTVNDSSIEADYVFISEHEDGKKTYTFWSKPTENSSWYLENYVLNEQDNGVLDAYIIRYDSLMVTHQDQIMVDDIKNHMELEYQGQLSGNSTTQRALYCPKVEFQELVYVPGVCSSEEHHETGEAGCHCGEPGYNCTPADEGFYVWTTVLIPTDCGGGGASPGGGVTPGSSPINTGPYNPMGSGGGIFDGVLLDPCQKLKADLAKAKAVRNNSNITNQNNQLISTIVSDTNEKGFAFGKDSNGNYKAGPIENLGTNGGNLTLINLGFTVEGDFHNHNGINTPSCFSATDIYGFHNNHSAISSYNIKFVNGSDDSQYVLTITDQDAFDIFVATYNMSNTVDVFNQTSNPTGTNFWKKNTKIYKLFMEVAQYFFSKGETQNNAFSYGMAYVLKKYNMGVVLSKRQTDGSFKPIEITSKRKDFEPEVSEYEVSVPCNL